ncbi:MAG: cell division protein CrgA [Aquiluna sp.]
MSESRSDNKKKSSKPIKPQIVGEEEENPRWYKATMFGFMLAGLIWILTRWVLQHLSTWATGTSWLVLELP